MGGWGGRGGEGRVMWVLLVTLKLLQLEQSEAGLWLFEIQSRARKSQLAVVCFSPHFRLDILPNVSLNFAFHESFSVIILTCCSAVVIESLFVVLLSTFKNSKLTSVLEISILLRMAI